jgi:lysophospholipase L1-like esterase
VSQNPAAPSFNRSPPLAGRTVRQILVPRLDGTRLRVRLSNTFGTTPLVIGAAAIGISAGGAAVRPGSDRALKFGGKTAVTVAPGAQRESDPVALEVQAGMALAVSVYADAANRPAGATTWHKVASQVNFVSGPGDHVAETGASAYDAKVTSYFWLDAISVETDTASAPPDGPAAAVAAIGDSITDGMRSSLNRNQRWPDHLARRLAEDPSRPRLAVLDLGISGNRLLSDSPCYGQALVSRFERDALGQPGVQVAIVLIGINDINFAAMPPHRGLDCDEPHTSVTTASLLAGYKRLIGQAHRAGVRIIGATITPADLPPEREALRQEVNRWIRGGGAFDGVADFDAALRDTARPARLLPRFDSGDHIHPSDAGYAALAAAVPLPLQRAHRR